MSKYAELREKIKREFDSDSLSYDTAIESARRNALHECPYRDRRWRSYWLSEFEKAQQVKIDFSESMK